MKLIKEVQVVHYVEEFSTAIRSTTESIVLEATLGGIVVEEGNTCRADYRVVVEGCVSEMVKSLSFQWDGKTDLRGFAEEEIRKHLSE
jgi:hypothetical protein